MQIRMIFLQSDRRNESGGKHSSMMIQYENRCCSVHINTYSYFLGSLILAIHPKSRRVRLKGLESHPQLIVGIELSVH